MSINASSVVATLGNPSSVVPLGVKDTINYVGSVCVAKKTGGAVEAKDRLIDEMGTQAIWLLGLPIFKKIFDKVVYKIAGIDPKVDIKLLTKSKDAIEFAIEKSEGRIKDSLRKVKDNPGLTKALFVSKFIFATTATILAYNFVANIRNYVTQRGVEKEHNKRDIDNHKDVSGKTCGGVSFSGIKEIGESFALDPVKNMMIIDLAISMGRLIKSRNREEFTEFILSEGAFWLCMYGLSAPVAKGLEWLSKKVFDKPIGIDIRVLTSNEFKESLCNGKVKEDIKDFKEVFEKNNEKKSLEFLLNHSDNLVVKMAKETQIINTIKENEGFINKLLKKTEDTGKIDLSKYIDLSEVNLLSQRMEQLAHKMEGLERNDIDKYLKQSQGLKVGSVLGSMAFCCLVLGVIVPQVRVVVREKMSGTKKFHVANNIEKELIERDRKLGVNQS